MNKEFIPYTLALVLKELGFDEPCMAQWNDSNGFDGFGGNYRNSYFTYPDQVAAPTFSQAFRWFREKCKLHSNIYLDYGTFYFIIQKYTEKSKVIFDTEAGDDFGTYEEAEIECLVKLIEIVKQNNNE